MIKSVVHGSMDKVVRANGKQDAVSNSKQDAHRTLAASIALPTIMDMEDLGSIGFIRPVSLLDGLPREPEPVYQQLSAIDSYGSSHGNAGFAKVP